MAKTEKKAAEKKAAKKTEKAPKEKKEKDPNAPKRPLTAFFIFSKESRDQFKEDNPQTKPSDISKLMGEAWKELSDEEKKPYVDKAAKLKEQYEKDVAKYKDE